MTEKHQHSTDGQGGTKKSLILELARGLGTTKLTAAEIEQIRRQMIARLGVEGKTAPDYIASVLKEAGMRVNLSTRTDSEDMYEEEFEDLLHFSTLEEAEMCIIRLDELWRKFHTEHEKHAAGRVREVAQLGRRRAEMISRNHKVDPQKRAEKEEIAHWFGIWLETPDAFFDWLEVRKKSPSYQRLFQNAEGEEN